VKSPRRRISFDQYFNERIIEINGARAPISIALALARHPISRGSRFPLALFASQTWHGNVKPP
jgi:hypothetical protein